MNQKTCYIKDFMSATVVTLTPDMEIMEAVRLLVEKGISGAPVLDQHGNLVGMLTEHDCIKVALNAGYYGDLGGRVSEFMHPLVETIDVDASILDVAEKFIANEYRRYPVVDENRLVGQISRHDVLKALIALASGKC
ncbi:MAG: CBS domain-containing protein [Gammaproteobacteria bacterium]|jgi:CBS domain-containing protein|nr:CBS domain-containing protein [Gammaproteobacteria bacterium]